jgi:hypothetical protein
MEKKRLRKLLNRITVKRYVNLHFNGFPREDKKIIDDPIKKIQKNQKGSYCITVNINSLPRKEKEAVRALIDIVNDTLAEQQFKHWIHEGKSIDNVLEQLNERLDYPGLIIFYPFKSPEDEKEKDMLRSIRKFIQMKDSLFLGILIISSHPTGDWDLSPYSDLDDRFVEYFSYS